MRPDLESTAYFDTPARAERAQLLRHLLRNASEAIYLRAPGGAGKTLFAHRLLDTLDDDYASVWIRGGVDNDIELAAKAQLGLDRADALRWPDDVIAGLGERTLLLVADDADRLDLAAFERLVALHVRGGRLLLLGHGELAGAAGDWDLQFVDLPPFSVEQSTAFVRQRAGSAADRIDDDLAGFMHHSAHGRPGLLLKELADVLARRESQRAAPDKPDAILRPWMKWLAGAAGVVLLAGVLLNQDRINAWFAAPPLAESDADGDVQQAPGPASDVPGRSTGETPADAPPPDLVLSRPAEPLPSIDLPELSRAGADAAAAGENERPAAMDEDPLAAVMRDAQAAAEAAAAPMPATPQASEPESAAAGESADDRAAQPVPAAVDDVADALVEAATPALANDVETAADADAGPGPGEASAPASEQAPKTAESTGTESAGAESAAPAEVVDATPVRDVAAPAGPVPAVADRVPAGGGMDWLKSRDPTRYTLQLIGARDRAAVEKYVREQKVEAPYAIFSRPLNGRPWYSLVAGDYADRDAAVAARSRLPGRISRTDVWPRSFASVQENLR